MQTLKVSAVDLFCGIGGLSHGLIKEDISVIAGYDIDSSCKYAYEINNNAQFIDKDVSLVTEEEINNLYQDTDIRVLVGCAPCQPFSTYTRSDKRFKDEKWALLYKFADIVEKVNPDVISMENVPQLTKYDVYEDFVKKLESLGYSVDSNKVFCPDYGIPQNRTRLVLLASKLGKIKLIEKTHSKENYKTVKQTIGHLSPIEDGQTDILDPLHFARKLSDKNKNRIKASKQGGSWRDWDQELVLKCHQKKSGSTYSGVYGRMSWSEPSPTMTTQCIGLGNGRFGHPEQDRAISLREAALFQTFPENYKFIEDYKKTFSSSIIARQIGNAVPVELGAVVGRSINEHLKEYINGKNKE